MLLLLLSLIAGILTILAPCVFPLLPVILGGSISNNGTKRGRPYIITAALAISIIFFTLLLKVSTLLINLSPAVLTGISGGIIIGLGCVTIFPDLWETLILKLNWQARSQQFFGESATYGGAIGPILIGIALGPVFSSCSPTYAFILASILPKNIFIGLIYLIAYTVGLAGTLLIVALLGRRIITKRFAWLIDTHSVFRKALGVIFIAIGILIVSGHEVSFETWLANRLPFDETKVEQFLLSSEQSNPLKKLATTRSSVLNVQATPAPALSGLTNWINSSPITLSSLKGKVVLVDFWTYSCVNCNRALPYVETWYKTYESKGLVVIGVHTPEFAFEHVAANVQDAVKTDGITYPVALDNNYDTWNAFNNDSWPADYLIDKNGNIRYVALGEGNYNVTEEAIQELLGLDQGLKTPTSTVPITNVQTPETYFGTNRASDYVGTPSLDTGTHTFTPTPLNNLALNNWTLNGSWNIDSSGESITSESGSAQLTFSVQAKDVYVVAGTTNNQHALITVSLPKADAGQYGKDAPNGQLNISGSSLYHIVSLTTFGSTTVTLTVPKGVMLYTFTFGS